MASIINASTSGAGGVVTTADASGELQFQTGGTTRQTIATDGNVGIGVTPSAWLSTRTVLEVRSSGTGVVGISNGNVQLSSNIYTNTSGNNIYGINGFGVVVAAAATSGEFTIFTAPSGTAGATATLSTALVVENGGNLRFNSGYGSAAVAYGCRAWVNFNGTGTVAIRASGNVTSITDNGTGDYTVNFTTAMPDANYQVSGIGCTSSGNSWGLISLATAVQGGTDPTTTTVRIKTTNSNATSLIDQPFVNISVHR